MIKSNFENFGYLDSVSFSNISCLTSVEPSLEIYAQVSSLVYQEKLNGEDVTLKLSYDQFIQPACGKTKIALSNSITFTSIAVKFITQPFLQLLADEINYRIDLKKQVVKNGYDRLASTNLAFPACGIKQRDA